MRGSVLGQEVASRAPPRFRVLGGVRVKGATVGPPQERAVLGILLLHPGHVVTTLSLMDALWGDDPPKSALHSIQVHVSELRRKLGADCIETTPSGYRLTIDRGEIDWCRFERAVGDAESETNPATRRRLLADALTLWTGDPLEDVGCLLATDVGRHRLTELHLVAIERWARASLEQGGAAGLIPELDAIAREHPLHEPLWECLMEALDAAGRQPEALRVFAEVRHNLGEVGLEPTPALRATEERILLSDERPTPHRSPALRRSHLAAFGGTAAALAIVWLVAVWAAPTPTAFLMLDPWTTERTDLHVEALEEIGRDAGIEIRILESGEPVPMDDLCGTGNVLVLAGPSSHEHATVAQDCPNTPVVALDVEPVVAANEFFSAPSVTPVVIDTEQAAFLAGAVAALESHTGRIGFVGGMPISAVDRLLAGFEAGATWVDPDTVVVATYLSKDTATGLGHAFDSPEFGYEAALTLFRSGVDIVFHAAGGSGQGILEAVVDSSTADRPLRFIGVELDARALASTQQQPYVLTSAITRLDAAIETVLERHLAGSLDGSPVHLGLSDGAVQISPNGAAIGEHSARLEEAVTLIGSGAIDVPLSPSPAVVYLSEG